MQKSLLRQQVTGAVRLDTKRIEEGKQPLRLRLRHLPLPFAHQRAAVPLADAVFGPSRTAVRHDRRNGHLLPHPVDIVQVHCLRKRLQHTLRGQHQLLVGEHERSGVGSVRPVPQRHRLLQASRGHKGLQGGRRCVYAFKERVHVIVGVRRERGPVLQENDLHRTVVVLEVTIVGVEPLAVDVFE